MLCDDKTKGSGLSDSPKLKLKMDYSLEYDSSRIKLHVTGPDAGSRGLKSLPHVKTLTFLFSTNKIISVLLQQN